MPHGNFIKETTLTTGGGDLELVLFSGFVRFSDRFDVGDTVEYTIRNQINWETGLGTVRAGDVLERTVVYETFVNGVLDNTSPSAIILVGASIIAGTLTAQKINEQVSIKDFGAVCDGSTDDSSAFQDAVDELGDTTTQRPGRIYLPGPIAIGNTVLAEEKSIVVYGDGWGSSSASNPNGSYLKWIGSAGSPMIQVRNSQGFLIKRLRFIGDSTAKPSAAINFDQQPSVTNSYNRVQDVWIGRADFDTNDIAEQFTAGILFDGIAGNNSQMSCDNVRIQEVEIGVDIQSTLYANNYFSNLHVDLASVAGVRTRGDMFGHNWFFSNNKSDIQLGTTPGDDPVVSVERFGSELAERMCTFGATRGTLILKESSFIPSASKIAADGRIINNVSNGAVSVTLDGFRLVIGGGYVGPTPKIQLQEAPGGAAAKSLYLRRVSGITEANIEMDTGVGPGNTRYIEFSDKGTNFGLVVNVLGDSESVDLSRNDLNQIRITGGISGTTTKANNLRGQATFATSGTVAVVFPKAESDVDYEIWPSGNVDENFWTTNKTVNGFTLNSSNVNSTANVAWLLIR